MADKIEYEYLADNKAVLAALEKAQQQNLRYEATIKKIQGASTKAGEAGAKSFAAMEKELRDNEAALKRMNIGTAEFERQRVKVDRLKESLRANKAALAGNTAAARAAAPAVNRFIGKIAGIAAGLLSVRAIATTLQRELEKLREVRLQSGRQERTFQESLAEIGQNIGGEQIAPARALIEQNAPLLKTTPEGLANLMGIAISAGAKDLKEALEVSSAALELTVGDASKAQELVGTSLDLTRAAQSENFRGALGQLLQTQSQVRSTDLKEFARNIGPALAAGSATRANQDALSTERTLEVAAVFSKILSDQTGAVTGTGVRQFVAKLDQFTPQLKDTLKDKSVATVSPEVLAQFRATRGFDERVELLRQNEGLARQFLDQQKEGQAKTAVAEFVLGSDTALELEALAKQAITSMDEAEATFDRLKDGIDAGTRDLQAVRGAQANIAAGAVTGKRAGEGTATEILEETFKAVDLPGADTITRNISLLQLEKGIQEGRDPAQVAAEVLTEIRDDLKTGVGGGLAQPGFRFREDREDLDLLEKQIAILEELAAATAAANRQREDGVPVRADERPAEVPVPAEAGL